MTTAVQMQSEYRNLPLVSLTESATNPRRSFDQTALGELADFVPGHKKRRFVPQTVLWPNVTNGAWQRAVRVPSDT